MPALQSCSEAPISAYVARLLRHKRKGLVFVNLAMDGSLAEGWEWCCFFKDEDLNWVVPLALHWLRHLFHRLWAKQKQKFQALSRKRTIFFFFSPSQTWKNNLDISHLWKSYIGNWVWTFSIFGKCPGYFFRFDWGAYSRMAARIAHDSKKGSMHKRNEWYIFLLSLKEYPRNYV